MTPEFKSASLPHTVTFFGTDGKQTGCFDFGKSPVTFTGDADDSAKMIEKLQSIINRARVEFFSDGSDSKVMQRMIKILNEMP